MSHNFCYNYSFLSDWMKANPHIKRMDLLNTLEMCDYGTLAKWLNGVTMMPLTQIMKFCNRYNVPITAFFYDELADDKSVFSPLHIDAMIEPANGWPDSNRKAGIKVCDPRSSEHIVSNLPKYVRLANNIQSKKEDTNSFIIDKACSDEMNIDERSKFLDIIKKQNDIIMKLMQDYQNLHEKVMVPNRNE